MNNAYGHPNKVSNQPSNSIQKGFKIITENGKKYEFEFGHRIYSAAELTALLKDCGFKSVKIFGDLAGADYDHNAKRLIAVAKK